MPDIAISPEEIRRRKSRRWLFLVGVIVLLMVGFFIVWESIPTGPSVSARDLLLGTVRQGSFLIQIRAPGILKPRKERWATSTVGGTIETLLAHPGSMVHVDSPLLKMSNPTLGTKLQEARFALSRTKAEAVAQQAQLEDQLYALEGRLASAKAQATRAEMRLKADASLLREAVISRLQYETDRLNAQNDTQLVASMKQRIRVFRQNVAAQSQTEQSLVASAQADLLAAEANIRALEPRAGIDGQVQTMSVQAGQSLAAGTAIARIANAQFLDATLAVSPNDAGEIAVGQSVEVQLPNPDAPIIHGTVARISPNVVNAAVPVTVHLQGKMPKGTRPQMAVTGIIRVSRMNHVLHVARPVGVQPESKGTVYVLSPDKDAATRRAVQFGLASSRGIQVVSGLTAGERIVLSDTSRWGPRMRIRSE